MRLDELAAEAAKCEACRLCTLRENSVFGEGGVGQLMFIGEAPGRTENRLGRPFVGRAGVMLTKMIRALRLSRADVYITNMVKCKPPNNRDPKNDELSACRRFLDAEISLVEPTQIILLGRVPAMAFRLLSRSQVLGSVRRKPFKIKGVNTRIIWHPAYIARTPRLFDEWVNDAADF